MQPHCTRNLVNTRNSVALAVAVAWLGWAFV